MPKKVIQVPVDEPLLKELNRLSKKRKKARAEFIREACETYIVQLEREEADRLYIEGYRRIPEEPELGEFGLAMMKEVLPEEKW